MQWIPVMVVVTIGCLVAAFGAVVLRPFARALVIGRRLAIASFAVGVGSPLLFLLLVGRDLLPIGYLLLSLPAFLAAIAVVIYRTPPAQPPQGFEVLPKDNGGQEAV